MAAAGREPDAQECSACHPSGSDSVSTGIWIIPFYF